MGTLRYQIFCGFPDRGTQTATLIKAHCHRGTFSTGVQESVGVDCAILLSIRRNTANIVGDTMKSAHVVQWRRSRWRTYSMMATAEGGLMARWRRSGITLIYSTTSVANPSVGTSVDRRCECDEVGPRANDRWSLLDHSWSTHHHRRWHGHLLDSFLNLPAHAWQLPQAF